MSHGISSISSISMFYTPWHSLLVRISIYLIYKVVKSWYELKYDILDIQDIPKMSSLKSELVF